MNTYSIKALQLLSCSDGPLASLVGLWVDSNGTILCTTDGFNQRFKVGQDYQAEYDVWTTHCFKNDSAQLMQLKKQLSKSATGTELNETAFQAHTFLKDKGQTEVDLTVYAALDGAIFIELSDGQTKKTDNFTQLIRSEEKFRGLCESMNLGIVLYDLVLDDHGIPIDAVFSELNESYSQLSGYDRDVIGKSLLEINPNIEKYWIETLGEIGITGTARYFENYYEEHNKYYGFYGYQPAKNQCACIVTDITDKTVVAKQIAHKQELLSLVYDNTNDMIVLVKVDGEALIIEMMNSAVQRTIKKTGFDVDIDDLIGLELQSLMSDYFAQVESDVAYRIQMYRELIASKKKFSYERSFTTDYGDFHFKFTLIPIVDNGTVTHVLSITRDISEEFSILNKLTESLSEVTRLKKQLENENSYLMEEIELVNNFDEIVFESEEFKQVLNQVEQVSTTSATVLIEGETGTGKELIARAIHKLSPRADKPMIKVNCAAIPRDLIESELFGHKKGAFTGAIADKLGKFKMADGGTLFLDEISEMPLELQPKILRALQEGEIEVVGSQETTKVQVRIIAAGNKDLRKLAKEGAFREDLYFRLNVFPIYIPPLRKRSADINPLVRHFVDKYSKRYLKTVKYISDDLTNYLLEYNWPGNVRELENLIERSVILCQNDRLTIPNNQDSDPSLPINTSDYSLEMIQKQHILRILRKHKWKIDGQSGAAEALSLPASTLRSKMAKFGIKRAKS